MQTITDKGVCARGFIWNPSNCDYENCMCRKKLVDKLIEECTDGEEIDNENEQKHKYSSCTVYIVLFLIILAINIGTGTYFVYFHWYLKKDS